MTDQIVTTQLISKLNQKLSEISASIWPDNDLARVKINHRVSFERNCFGDSIFARCNKNIKFNRSIGKFSKNFFGKSI